MNGSQLLARCFLTLRNAFINLLKLKYHTFCSQKTFVAGIKNHVLSLYICLSLCWTLKVRISNYKILQSVISLRSQVYRIRSFWNILPLWQTVVPVHCTCMLFHGKWNEILWSSLVSFASLICRWGSSRFVNRNSRRVRVQAWREATFTTPSQRNI